MKSLLLVTLTASISLFLPACSNKTAEEKAKDMATEKVDMVKGIGDAIQDKGSAAAESLTTGVGKVMQGVEKGVEKSKRTVVVTEAARQAGLEATKVQLAATSSHTGADIAASAPGALQHGLDVYLVSQKAVEGQLKVKVFNPLDQEIGRAKIALKQDADEANYVRIPMSSQVDLNAITKVEVDYQATQNPAQSTAR